MRAVVAGMGYCLPGRVLDNQELSRMVDTSDEWIVSRTGIRERRILEPGHGVSELAIPAARSALERAGLAPEEVDLVICATSTPDTIFPATAIRVQTALGCTRAGGYDLLAACSGFVYAVDQAWCSIRAGVYRNVLVVGADAMSSITDYQDRGSCIIFGDAAGALVLSAREGEGDSDVVATELGGALDEESISLPAGGSKRPASSATLDGRLHYLKMDGRRVFDFAVKKFRELVSRSAERSGIRPADIDWVIPHQVNRRIIDSALKKLDVPAERVLMNLERVGNTSAASIPVALAEAVEDGRVRRGDWLCMAAFGAGLTWGSAMLRY